MGVKVKEWKGAWWVFINHKGRRRAKRCASKKAANVIADKIDAALKLGQVGILDERPAGPTFEGLAYEWLKVYPVTRSVSRTTMENYESFTLRHLLPFFGPMRVAEITHKTVEAFVAEKRGPSGSLRMKGKPLAEQSLRVGLVALRLVLNRAVKDGFLPSNPAVGVVRFTRTDEQTGDPFTGEELREGLAAATRINPTFATFLRLWAQTGMREGEMLALQQQDLDLKAGRVIVDQTFTRQRLGPPKTRRSRAVWMAHPIIEETAEWRPGITPESRRVLADLQRLPVRALNPEAFVFGIDQPWSTAYVNAEWRRVLHAAQVRYRSPEQLRHTFASTLLSRNAPPLYVQEQGGWRSAAVLFRVYARWLPSTYPGDAIQTAPAATPAQPALAK